MVIANHVTRTFSKGTVTALRDVNVRIRQGETVGLIGKNGAGKTTFLKLAVGMLAPSSGEIWTLEGNPCESIAKNRKDIGYLFAQYRALEFVASLKEGCGMQKNYFRMDAGVYEEIYREIGVPLGIVDFYERPPRQLSVGEYRCAEFFYAVMHCPKLLFLDEPTIGVDEHTKHVICDVIRLLNQKYHATVLIASHDMEMLQHTCSKSLVLYDGELAFDGSWEHLKQMSDVYRKVRFQSDQMIDFEDLPIHSVKFENGNMELLISQRQMSEQDLYTFLMKKAEVRDFCVEEPPLETICCEILKLKL